MDIDSGKEIEKIITLFDDYKKDCFSDNKNKAGALIVYDAESKEINYSLFGTELNIVHCAYLFLSMVIMQANVYDTASLYITRACMLLESALSCGDYTLLSAESIEVAEQIIKEIKSGLKDLGKNERPTD